MIPYWRLWATQSGNKETVNAWFLMCGGGAVLVHGGGVVSCYHFMKQCMPLPSADCMAESEHGMHSCHLSQDDKDN